MNYYKKIILALEQIKKNDKWIISCFVFGSFVTNETSLKNYKETEVFQEVDFLLLKLDLVDVASDVDILCVSEKPEATRLIFNKEMSNLRENYVTVNIVSKKVFERELFSVQPTAIKRILLYKKLFIIEGEKYIQIMKTKVIKMEKPIDKIFQKEFDFKKEYMKLFIKYNIDAFSIHRSDYDRLFPNLLRFIQGKLEGGFPKDRIKLVYPKPMDLKFRVDLAKNTIPHNIA